ncbi:hypothetical protein OG455_27795 [Kitasatospora sp. NBC_01287]|uniref:hypothetical protein n=1 Tax=Kitasatospora sp. NBC_01287 TaxID=2903573 RepID=UPI0022545B85|nr:hypothetical protein [Kitasatospora sp. NBC_01287]MCX4749265.1 hypothetical protein [Kitasatospora sp. NBC_01287]
MTATATIAPANELIAAVRDCFPSDTIAGFTETYVNLLVDPYGDRIVKVEAETGDDGIRVEISLIHPELGLIGSISRTYRGDASDRLIEGVFKFLKGVFNYTWM